MQKVVVVGAGIVGTVCAVFLQKAGVEVVLIDRDQPGRGASYGNASGLAIGEIIPMASPGVLKKVPRYLFDRDGPLVIDPKYLPICIPWLWRFVFYANPRHLNYAVRMLAELCGRAHRDYQVYLEDVGAVDLLIRRDSLRLYRNEAQYRQDAFKWDLRRQNGIIFDRLTKSELRSLEPAVSEAFEVGIVLRGHNHFRDPLALVEAGIARLQSGGGDLVRGEVTKIVPHSLGGATAVLDDGRRISGDRLVVAAGAWSGDLCRQLGDALPLESERGYHAQIPDPGVEIGRSITDLERAVAITPLSGGLRVAGKVEFAGLKAAPNYRYAKLLLAQAKEILPGLKTTDASYWMGHRPSTPDGLPVIGFSRVSDHIIYALGHGHLGLTLAATTGRIVVNLATGADPGLDLRPMGAQRFGG